MLCLGIVFAVLTASAFALPATAPDLERARQRLPSSAFTSTNPHAISVLLNQHLAKSASTKSCEQFSLRELDELAAALLAHRDDRLNLVYTARSDNRALRHNVSGWEAETSGAATASKSLQLLLREGKCAEIAMLWTHHLSQHVRAELSAIMTVPLLSEARGSAAAARGRAAVHWIERVYAKQLSCAICHYRASDAPTLPPRHTAGELPPVWPAQFHVNFTEVTHQFKTTLSEGGSFHLDYPGERMLWSHGEGQYNNWCECAGLAANEARRACAIASLKTKQDPSGAAYVVFRELGKCCKLAGWDKGFSPIRPDWLVRPTNATFLGSISQGGRVCYQWVNPNHGNPLMTGDIWSEDALGVPCTYVDRFAWWAERFQGHNLTFDPGSYSLEPEPDSRFAVTDGLDCSKTCPNRHTWCFFTTI